MNLLRMTTLEMQKCEDLHKKGYMYLINLNNYITKDMKVKIVKDIL